MIRNILLAAFITSSVVSFAQTHTIKIVAHRGASKFAPENTIAAFLKAAEMGADYAEMDVRQTRDGHFIIMHDAAVNRTTDGTGDVSTMTLEQIKKLDAGSHFSPDFAGEKVPTLREALKAIKGKILPDIDYKAGDLKELVKVLDEEGYLTDGNVTFHGSRDEVKAVSELTTKLLVRPSSFDGARGFPELVKKVNPPIVNIGKAAFSDYYIKLIHHEKKLAFVNALRRADKKKFMQRAIDAGADFIQADNLDVLVPLVKSSKSQAPNSK